MAIVDVRDITVLEPDFSSRSAVFTLFIDEPATAPITVSYFLQGGSASESTGDFNEFQGTATIAAGTTFTTISTSVFADAEIEGNENFFLYVKAGQNAELPDGAAVLKATATIFDLDDPGLDPPVGEGALAERIQGPKAEPGVLPTIDVANVSLLEGDFSSDPARFLLTLDRVANAPVTVRYFLQGVEASDTKGDFSEFSSSITIPAGEQAGWINTSVFGDALIEGDERFNLVIYSVTNAQFPEGAVALRATATILDDDDAGGSRQGEISGPSEKIEGPGSASDTLPTVTVNSVSVFEGDFSSEAMRFLVKLDQAAPTDITFSFAFENGTAVEGQGDFDQRRGTFTISEGETAAELTTSVFGDNLIEEDETFSLVLYNLQNAVFAGGAPILKATGTIIDDDGGPPSDVQGVKDSATQVFGPEDPAGVRVRIDVTETSIIESDFSSDSVGLYAIFSEALPTDIVLGYEVFPRSAQAGSDYSGSTSQRQWRLDEGDTSDALFFSIFGDTDIEPSEEEFFVRLTVLSGDAVFEGNSVSTEVDITIFDNNDGVVTEGEKTPGPDFKNAFDEYIGTDGEDTEQGSARNDIMRGEGGDDSLNGGAGNDELRGGRGEDTLEGDVGSDSLFGNTGEDEIYGGGGTDVLRGQRNADFLNGGGGNDNIKGGGGKDTLEGGSGDDFLKGGTRQDVVRGGSGEDRLFGNSFDDTLNGGTGDDFLNGGGQNDSLIGGLGDDTLKGGAGADVFVFGAGEGDDVFIDFNVTQDTLELETSLLGGRSLSAFLSSASVSTSGNTTTLTFSGTESIELRGVDSGEADQLSSAIELF
ncbi:MAG: Calx-beta domain-containing protein [Pseudomonadota bacterium]